MANDVGLIDLCGFQRTMTQVEVLVRGVLEASDAKNLLTAFGAESPDSGFLLVAEAFDAYRETYVQKGDVGEALVNLAMAAVLAKGF